MGAAVQHVLIISRILGAALQHMQHPTGTALLIGTAVSNNPSFASEN